MTESFFLAPALVQLRNEVNNEFPNRDKSSDGWIGDPSHAARVSDHNPCWVCAGRLKGVVRAVDIDVDDNDPGRDLRRMILKACIGDSRVWYVISNQVIYSRTHNWAALRYTGSNGHFHHVHTSLVHGKGEFDTSPWLRSDKPRVLPQRVDLSTVREIFLDAALSNKWSTEPSTMIARVQRSLNAKMHMSLTPDGVLGPRTLAAWQEWERKVGVRGRPRVPDDRSLQALVEPRYRMVA